MELVQEKLDEQFYRDCDPLRNLESERLKKRVAKECQELVAYKKQREEEERVEEDAFARLAERDYQIKTERFEAEVAQSRLKRRDMDEKLLMQIDANNAAKAQMREDKCADAMVQEDNDRYERELKLYERLKKEENQNAMREYLDKQTAFKNRLNKQFADEENALIAQMLEKDDREAKAAITDERQSKMDYAREYQRYLDYVRQFAEDKKQREKDLDRELQEVIDEKLRIQDERERQERLERQYQTMKTQAVRQQQLRDREAAKRKEDQEMQELLEGIKAQRAREEQRSGDSLQQRRDAAMKLRQDLEQQMAFKAEQQRQDKLRELDEQEAQRIAECQYQRKVEEMANRPPPLNKHPFRHSIENPQPQYQVRRSRCADLLLPEEETSDVGFGPSGFPSRVC